MVSVHSRQDAFLPTPSPRSPVPKLRSSDGAASGATRPDVLAALTGAQIEQRVPFLQSCAWTQGDWDSVSSVL